MEIRKTLTAPLIALGSAALIALSASSPLQTNHPPTVKIESPTNNAVLDINTPITYQVHVTDPEDGDSRYDEINTKEVILELAWIKPGSKIPPTDAANSATTGSATHSPTTRSPTTHSSAAHSLAAEPSALDIMATNNCFNCHQFNAQSLGPSFFDIAKRYAPTAANTDTLTRRIKDGSSGIWPGTEKMPSHPELPPAAIRSTVRWILQSAARPDHAWFIGTTGILHFPSNRPGTYTFTASYTDHGTKDQPSSRLWAADRIVVRVK
jgi:cytochrome c